MVAAFVLLVAPKVLEKSPDGVVMQVVLLSRSAYTHAGRSLRAPPPSSVPMHLHEKKRKMDLVCSCRSKPPRGYETASRARREGGGIRLLQALSCNAINPHTPLAASYMESERVSVSPVCRPVNGNLQQGRLALWNESWRGRMSDEEL